MTRRANRDQRRRNMIAAKKNRQRGGLSEIRSGVLISRYQSDLGHQISDTVRTSFTQV
jgi:hypothetical protein